LPISVAPWNRIAIRPGQVVWVLSLRQGDRIRHRAVALCCRDVASKLCRSQAPGGIMPVFRLLFRAGFGASHNPRLYT
jgi:hypothetical protein